MKKKINVSFNYQMQLFRKKYEINNMKRDMKPFWMYYQKMRFKEVYFPMFKKENNKKGTFEIIIELIYLLLRWKCIPFHYFRYALYKKKYSFEDIKKYLPETVFYYSILPKINSNYNLLDNKNINYDILKANNITIPICVIKVINKNIFDGNGNVINNDKELMRLLKYCKYNEIVGKFSDCGSGGKQIVILKRENGIYEYNKQSLNCNLLSENFNNWIFQERLYNISEIATLHPHSLNTFRVMTYIKGKQPLVLYCMLKFGNNNAQTDNAHTNGIYVKVNIKTGITENLAFNENLEEFNKHPLSNYNIDNITIPNFKYVLEIAKKAAMLFSNLTFVGWDIALTNSGPVVIEGNSSPGLTIIQRTHNGMEEFLKMYENKN